MFIAQIFSRKQSEKSANTVQRSSQYVKFDVENKQNKKSLMDWIRVSLTRIFFLINPILKCITFIVSIYYFYISAISEVYIIGVKIYKIFHEERTNIKKVQDPNA